MDRLFRWDPSYSVNIAELDRQHQQLFRTLVELDQALQNGTADSIIEVVLENLIQYTIRHFAAEENLMQKHGFPGLSAHRYDHQLLAQKLTKFNLSQRAGHPEIPSNLLPFLKAWWQDHVLKTDKEYSEFLNARGIR
jgi:hemerythrin-like metal-binding protein